MTDNGSITVEAVPSGMRPSSDCGGARKPAGGSVLRTLLADVLPRAARALVAGPHEREVVELVAAHSEQVTVLLRSAGDAGALNKALVATNVTVVAGALDSFADRADLQRYDVVVAADGLDRLHGTDPAALDWPRRVSALARTVTAGGLVVLGCDNGFAVTELLDRRPADDPHGLLRPASPDQLTAAVAEAGLGDAAVYAVFGAEGRAHTVVDTLAVAATRPGRPAARLAVRALNAATVETPLLAPPADAADAAARAGLLAAVASGWVALCGGVSRAHTVYAEAGVPGSVLTADRDTHGWQVRVVAGEPTGAAEPSGPVVAFSPDAVPALVPDTESVEQVLLRLAAAGDLPGFGRLAARLGEWARERDGGDTTVFLFDDLGVDGDTFALGLSGLVTTAPAAAGELLAAAWHRFQDRMVRGHRRHPWVPRVAGGDLVPAWLAMSGAEATTGTVNRGREIADAVAVAVAAGQGGDPEIDLRTALADADAARLRVHELGDHIAGLERTIGFRDRQLLVRESRIRELRQELRVIEGSRAVQVAELIRKAAKIRRPRQFAGGVKRRLRRLLNRG